MFQIYAKSGMIFDYRLKMKKYFSILIIPIFLVLSLNAQEEESLKGDFYLAPDFGLLLGTINQIEVSPALGYHLTDRFSAAIGFKYEFYSETRVYANQQVIKTHIYGPRTFLRYSVFKNLGTFLPIGMNTTLFTHAEFESSSLELKYFGYPNYPENGRFWYNAFLIGGGFSQKASERVSINVLVLWNTDSGYISLYNSPIIRFGFQFYLRPIIQKIE